MENNQGFNDFWDEHGYLSEIDAKWVYSSIVGLRGEVAHLKSRCYEISTRAEIAEAKLAELQARKPLRVDEMEYMIATAYLKNADTKLIAKAIHEAIYGGGE